MDDEEAPTELSAAAAASSAAERLNFSPLHHAKGLFQCLPFSQHLDFVSIKAAAVSLRVLALLFRTFTRVYLEVSTSYSGSELCRERGSPK